MAAHSPQPSVGGVVDGGGACEERRSRTIGRRAATVVIALGPPLALFHSDLIAPTGLARSEALLQLLRPVPALGVMPVVVALAACSLIRLHRVPGLADRRIVRTGSVVSAMVAAFYFAVAMHSIDFIGTDSNYGIPFALPYVVAVLWLTSAKPRLGAALWIAIATMNAATGRGIADLDFYTTIPLAAAAPPLVLIATTWIVRIDGRPVHDDDRRALAVWLLVAALSIIASWRIGLATL